MFSPDATLLSARGSQRNPRRRQRKDSDGLQQQPRRKRSKLGEDNFVSHSPKDAHVNGNGSAVMNGHVRQGDADSSLVLVDMPVREKKALVKRALKDDSTRYLTRNENFSVKQLPSFPGNLKQGSPPFRASALPSAGLALALTSSHALAWDYTSPGGPTRVLTLPLPFGLKPSDPLPFGTIVRNGPTNDFGIVAIAPSSGKITFWENVDSAEAHSQYAQRPQGVEGSVKLFSGETITNLVDIEHAGYVIVFSSGRLAQLTLRDSQGRPNVTTNVMSAPTGPSSGFFSFKGLLGGVRKPIASVKARQSKSKGQMEVVTATKNGVFQIWDLSWSGQQIFKNEKDVHGELLGAAQAGTAVEARGQQDAHVLDFVIMEPQTSQGQIRLLVLVALLRRDAIDYSLLEVVLTDENGGVTRAIPVRNFQQAQLPKEPAGTLLLPQPEHTAFVMFPGALFMTSLAEPEESPETQLLADSGKASLPFQDSIYLRDDRRLDFCGSALETVLKKDNQSSVLAFIQGYGIVQISALAPPSMDDDIGRRKVTAKSKLEQATFFSTIPDNILDFSIESRYSFGEQEVEDAGTDISNAILTSSYDHLQRATSSMDEQIRKRATALRTLITNLRAEYPPLSYPTKWTLLWNAEKLAASLALWNTYQEQVQDSKARPDAYPETLLLPHMVKCLHERFKTQVRPELGETDPVRQFFIKNTNSLEVLLPWAWQTLRTFYLGVESKERASILQRLSEGNDVVLASVEAAFKFREENIELYGLDPNAFFDGLLKPDEGQDLLPQFWTSTHNMVASIRSLIDVGRTQAYESFESGTQEGLAMKIAQDNPRLIKLGCQTHIERFTWALAQADEKKQDMGKSLREEWNKNVRPEHIYGLVDLGLATDGMNLAERYQDMHTLAHLIWDETRYMEETKEKSQSKMEQAECVVKLNRIKERIHRYFDKYGSSWADAFYTRYSTENRTGLLFDKEFLNQPALTKYLRTHRSQGRLMWINEVCGEENYELAHDALVSVAMKQETNAWCKKVELSIAKLALLSKQELDPGTGRAPEPNSKDNSKLAQTAAQLEYVKIQDALYERMAPTISGALDDESALQLLMSDYGQGRLAERPAHQQLLQQGIEALISNRALEPALLIDILTLMSYDESVEATEITQHNEFAFALKALVLSWNDLNKSTRTNLLKLIWKRVCIKDDWAAINDTTDISDDQLQEVLADTSLGRTLYSLIKEIEKHPFYKVAWPRPLNDLLGAGCTNGELCIRFPSEDLRNPIIADNLADDEILQANIEKYRLDHWFTEVGKAAKRAYQAERGHVRTLPVPNMDADDDSVEGIDEDPLEAEAANNELTSGANGGTDEGGVDVEMQDS